MAGNRGLAGLRLPPMESTERSQCSFLNHPRSPAVTEGETTLHNPHPPLTGKTGKEKEDTEMLGMWGGGFLTAGSPLWKKKKP